MESSVASKTAKIEPDKLSKLTKLKALESAAADLLLCDEFNSEDLNEVLELTLRTMAEEDVSFPVNSGKVK